MTIRSALSADNQARVRTQATKQVLQKTDRILGMGGLQVKIEPSNVPAPAFTDGRIITINSDWEPGKTSLEKGFTTKSMLTVTALNYHELAHCMFMPRLDTHLVREIRNKGAFHTFNILQDQADETRFVKLYDPARNYFTALVTQYMLETDEHLAYNYVLVSGRNFIPNRLRVKLQDRFHRPEIIPEVDALIAEYKRLVYPDDQKRMLEVTLDLHTLINDISSKMTQAGTTHENIARGEPDTETSKRLAKQEEDDYEATDDEEPEDEAAASGDDDDQPEDEQSEAGKGQPSSDESENTGDDKDEGASRGADGSPGDDTAPDEPSLEDTLEEVYDEVFGEVEEEVEDRIESVRDHESDYTVEQDKSNARKEPPTPELLQTVRRCVDEFREVHERHAPGWHVNQRHGKLNHRQYARALQGNEFVFRRWREGVHDALDFEVTFLLDQSYSMQGTYINNASQALWVLRRTFEELEGIDTVLGFHNYTTLLSQRGERVTLHEVPMYDVGGGTNVTPAIQEATRILNTSQKPLRLCVIVTDGAFNDRIAARMEMEHVNNPISIIGIQTDVDQYQDVRNVVHTQRINNPMELVDVVKNLALRLSDERLSQRS